MPSQFQKSPLPVGVAPACGRTLLVLLHLCMVATAYSAQRTLAMAKPTTRPYLASIAAPALRFSEATPTPPVLSRPVASGPPVAAVSTKTSEVALANTEAAASTPPMPAPQIEPPTQEEAPSDPTPVSNPHAMPILPDDTRRKIQTQDFLPLFRFPGSAGSPDDVTVIAPVGVPTPPATGTLPPSSATYRQY